MAWRVDYSRTALDRLGKLDRQIASCILDYMNARIATLENPRSAGKALSGPLGGLWRYRVGDYRVICEIQDEVLRVLVIEIGNRREVYR